MGANDDDFLVGMIANRKKLLRAPGAPPPGVRQTLESALVEVARELAAEVADKLDVQDPAQFTAYFRRYCKQVAYDYVELQRRKAGA